METSIGVIQRVQNFSKDTLSEARNDVLSPPQNWPTRGAIEFQNVTADYGWAHFVYREICLLLTSTKEQIPLQYSRTWTWPSYLDKRSRSVDRLEVERHLLWWLFSKCSRCRVGTSQLTAWICRLLIATISAPVSMPYLKMHFLCLVQYASISTLTAALPTPTWDMRWRRLNCGAISRAWIQSFRAQNGRLDSDNCSCLREQCWSKVPPSSWTKLRAGMSNCDTLFLMEYFTDIPMPVSIGKPNLPCRRSSTKSLLIRRWFRLCIDSGILIDLTSWH